MALVSSATFFHAYSQGVCQARCTTGLLKSMALFLLVGQHPKSSYTSIFGKEAWLALCFFAKDSRSLTNKNLRQLLSQMHMYTDCKHQEDLQREQTSEITERFMVLYCLSICLQPGSRNAAILRSRHGPFQVQDGITAMGHACLNRLT